MRISCILLHMRMKKAAKAAPGTSTTGNVRSTMTTPFGAKKGMKRAPKRGGGRVSR
jgi:hypothetical protein